MNKVYTSQSVVNFAISGQWIVIDSDITLTANVTMGENVVIEFQGGRILSHVDVHITGTYTKVVAPITQIFGDNIICDGYWTIDRAYPQWFSDLSYSYHLPESAYRTDPKRNDDWSVAINKAIVMKWTGEVFMPRGHYYIKNPIEVKYGITLCGESGRRNTPVDQSSSPTNYSFGTFIEPSSVLNDEDLLVSQFNGLFLINVNKRPNAYNWQFNHPQPSMTKVCNLSLGHIYQTNKVSNVVKGICCFGGAVFDSLYFRHLYSAVSFDHNNGLYSDGRQIYNCLVDFPDVPPSSDEEFYAFSLSNLGDNVRIQNNQTSSSPFMKALRLGMCYGGVVSGNIFNSDVHIMSCKGIDFNSNHMEDGAQLRVTNSNVSIKNNFFEKGCVPSVWIQGDEYGHMSVVSLENNSYACYDYASRVAGQTVKANIKRIKAICNYDISVGQNCNVSIKNEYRFDITKLGIGMMYAFGVQLQKFNEHTSVASDFSEFNQYSHVLSKECYISVLKLAHLTIPLLSANPSIYVYAKNDNVQWFSNSRPSYLDTCYYRYKFVVYDNNGTIKSSTQYSSIYDLKSCYTGQLDNFGILITVGGATDGRQYKVKIFRRKSLSASFSSYTVESTIVYICGANALYDNGISICGYKWVEDSD